MKIIIIVLLTIVSYAIAGAPSSNWFRVANHIGTSVPAAIKFKSCGLPNMVFVNAKDTGRIGFGYDVDAQSNPASGLCTNGCSDSDDKREADHEEFERGEDGWNPDALYAQDSAVNFMIYWGAYSSGAVADKIFTRIANGDVSYSLGSDTTLTVSNTNQLDSYTNIGDEVVRLYPDATFQFFSDNHVITQNWYFEQANPDFACTDDDDNANDMVHVFEGPASSDVTFRTRVLFTFTDDTPSSGVVAVAIEVDEDGNLVQHIRTFNCADCFPYGGSWVDSIQVLVVGSDGNTYINWDSTDEESSTPSATTFYSQACTDVSTGGTILDKKRAVPLVSSSN